MIKSDKRLKLIIPNKRLELIISSQGMLLNKLINYLVSEYVSSIITLSNVLNNKSWHETQSLLNRVQGLYFKTKAEV